MAQNQSASRRSVAIGAAFLAGAGLAALLWLSRTADDAPAPAPSALEETRADAPARPPLPEPRVVDPREGPIVIRPHESIAIAAKDLDGDAPVAFELAMPAAVGVKSARLVTPDLRTVLLDDELRGQRGTVSLTLPSAQLRQPGRYLLDVRTDERTALPGRRFGIVVR